MALTLVALSAVLSLAAAGDFLAPYPSAGLTNDVGLRVGKAVVPFGANGPAAALNVPVAPQNAIFPAPLSAKHLLPGTAAVQGYPASAITGNSYVPGFSLGGPSNAAFKAANFPVFPAQQTVAITKQPVVKVPAVPAHVVSKVPAARAFYDAAPGLDAFPQALRAEYSAFPGFRTKQAGLSGFVTKQVGAPAFAVPQPLQPTVFAKQPTVFAKQPTVFAKQPTVFAKQPTVLAKQPTVFAKQPTVFAQQPTVFAKQPTVFAKQPTLLQAVQPQAVVANLGFANLQGFYH